MAENIRTQTKAAIKRASTTARNQANKLDRKALDELTALYKQSAKEISDVIDAHASEDGNLSLNVLTELLSQVNARIERLADARNSLLSDKMLEAAQMGITPFQAVSTVAVGSIAITQSAHDAVQVVHKFIAADGLQLSDRLWRLDNHAKQAAGDAIQLAVIQGHSASQAALDFISTGQRVPGQLAAKVKAASSRSVGRNVVNELIHKKGNPYDNALRVFRTEINRAHGTAYEASAFSHPDVIGTRFLLSPNHPKVDICDMHAKANLYGLGAGVYPKGKTPWPAHPNTLSYTEAVFSDEVSDEDKTGKTDRIAYLKSLSPIRQNAILGQAKGWMLRKGLLNENGITTPWKVLKARLEKAGIDVFHAATEKINALTSSTRISDFVEPTAYFSQVDNAMNAIEKVHRVRGLPVVEVFKSADKNANGFYNPNNLKIGITNIATQPEFTILHEVGHYLDHKGFVGAQFSSVNSDLFANWRSAVADSPEIQNLVDIFYGKRDDEISKLGFNYSKQHAAYLLETEEMWARSYSQWVARKSGGKIVNDQLDARLNRQRNSAFNYTSQWEDENFKPISDAIDNIFNKMGWLNNE